MRSRQGNKVVILFWYIRAVDRMMQDLFEETRKHHVRVGGMESSTIKLFSNLEVTYRPNVELIEKIDM